MDLCPGFLGGGFYPSSFLPTLLLFSHCCKYFNDMEKKRKKKHKKDKKKEKETKTNKEEN